MSNEMEDFCKLQAYADSHEFHGSELSGYAAQAGAETLLGRWRAALGEDNHEPLAHEDAAEMDKTAPAFRHIDDISTPQLRKLLP